MPTLTYGCEMWLLSDRDVNNLERFQRLKMRVEKFKDYRLGHRMTHAGEALGGSG